MRHFILTIVLLCLCLKIYAQAEPTAMKRAINALQDLHHINFVYDSSLETTRPSGTPLPGKSLEENLQAVFGKTVIRWEKKDDYILLFRQNYHTFSGYVCQENGETLINVTIFDQTTKAGTLSNEHGFFSLTLPEGKHNIYFSYLGYQDTIRTIDLHTDYQTTICLKENAISLQSIEVIGNLNSSLNTTQTGKMSFTADQLNTTFSLLSSPDLVKKLQQVSGVSTGTELLSGLYVHGGRNNENLFLIDGTPLYQVNHAGGLFSAFNTDIVKNVDFYKSGFPARYGGRLSSVIDVRTKDGDKKEFHGNFSIGLLDGRLQFEGPIVKDRTSFNFAIRRSWLDALSGPAFFFYRRSHPDHNINVRYAFHDINGKITHHFSDKNKLSLSVYSGNDLFKLHSKQNDTYGTNSINRYKLDFNVKWGNQTAALAWNCQLTSKLSGNLTAIYAHNQSKYDYIENEKTWNDGECTQLDAMERRNYSTIDDTGYRIEFDYRPNMNHHIRFGNNYLHHLYRPQHAYDQDLNSNTTWADSLSTTSSSRYYGNEFTLYAEDDMRLTDKLQANAGLHYTLYQVSGAVYQSLEPRLAISYRLSQRATLKASYTEMSQFVHQLSNTYLNLPTDCWVPSTRNIHPMRSRQIAGGVYLELPLSIQASIEGYYRTSLRMLECDGGNTLTLPANAWERMVKSGKGKSYGVEISLAYNRPKTTLEASYTLSWSKLKFTDFYPDWYPSKFDNRHKLNLAFHHRFSKRIDVYAAWTYRSGDRATAPTQYIEKPDFPGIPAENHSNTFDTDTPQLVYEKPNNLTLPAYHRLDIGVNFRKTTKRGFERIWNLSLYNAYCRMNTFYTQVEQRPDGSFKGKGFGLFPILPSFSYTLKF